MLWYLLALSSVIALATAELLQQRILTKQNSFHPRESAVFTYLFQAILIFIFILLSPFRNNLLSVFHPDVFPSLIVVSFLTSIAMIFYLKSFQVKAISISSIFMSVSIVVSTVLGIIVFQESTEIIKIIGIFCILISIIILHYKNVTLEKNHYFGLLAGFIYGICYVLDKTIVLQIGPVIYMFWVFLFSSIFGFLFSPKRIVKTIKTTHRSAYRLIAFSGISYFIFNILSFHAYVYGGEVGRVDAINNTQTFLIILFEYFILRHTSSMRRKIATAVLAYIGVLLLAIH